MHFREECKDQQQTSQAREEFSCQHLQPVRAPHQSISFSRCSTPMRLVFQVTGFVVNQDPANFSFINALQLRFVADRPHHLFDRVNDYVGSVNDDEMTTVLRNELLAVT